MQKLSEDDFDRRLELCEEMAQIFNHDDSFAQNIYFSVLTKQLTGIEEAHTQDPQKINVWARICRGNIIGPFFIDGT